MLPDIWLPEPQSTDNATPDSLPTTSVSFSPATTCTELSPRTFGYLPTVSRQDRGRIQRHKSRIVPVPQTARLWQASADTIERICVIIV
ncbi:hypothetical protein BGZ61DRAFT_71245 [Ilyonectria robusta]|uniref:uncharacterized protein n=1 Tax=Ilyonectria robusta TaxID=1079257 RepID=UPI001E8EE69E|nr:uncharacterized protein BGZ61DRAFT_71245 [Ilyonectria robusta]KAH8676922.1 hypothetical protein BGZ61DRAFT_71245 [Ilyonectria robusta]